MTLDAPDDRTAVALARHLIGEPPTAAEIARWRDAIAARGAALERERDRRLWRLIVAAPALAGPVDAGLALTDPHSPVRHRLCLLLAVLEASPVHTRRFLPREIGALGWLALGARMVRAGFRSALGVVLVRGAAARWP